ncbi:hypothetical protein QUA40_26465 [Microcoleus sp. Pol11C3]|uniref:hypothetical protein n=1 Tax=Microcoleus sp. Pol11C3 TaxID=3055390 RepID=UPI002FD5A781
MAFNPLFLTTLPTTSLLAEPQIKVVAAAAGKIENGKKQITHHQTPEKIAVKVIEEKEALLIYGMKG